MKMQKKTYVHVVSSCFSAVMMVRRPVNVLGILAILAIHGASFFQLNLINSKTFSSEILNKLSHLAIDGDTKTCSITELNSTSEEHPWWRVELDRDHNVTDLSIYFIPDMFLKSNLTVYVSSKADNFEEHLCITSKYPLNTSVSSVELKCNEPAIGKFVTIKKVDGLKKKLVLCEVYVYADRKTVNLALWRPTFESGLLFRNESTSLVDNLINTCQVIIPRNEFPWWRVVLDDSYYVTDVNMYFSRKSDKVVLQCVVRIYVSNDNAHFGEHLCGYTTYPNSTIDEKKSINVTCTKPTLGSYVTISKYKNNKPKWLFLCEVEIFSKEDPKEINITETSKNCLAHEYGCYQAHCINLDLTCDGTEDCPYGDDERMTACKKCDVGKFKCTKRYFCVANTTRCDGKADCPDYSDEHSCFDIDLSTGYLTATYKGTPGYYVCSKNWKIKYSIGVCSELNSFHQSTKYVELNDKTHKYLILKAYGLNKYTLPQMKSFSINEGSNCGSKRFIQIKCHKGDGAASKSLCGSHGYPDGIFKPYIIRGRDAKLGAWPWQVQVFRGTGLCGGSIINKDWILTAAHCLKNTTDMSTIHIKAGTVINNNRNVKNIPISYFVNHPEYTKNISLKNDISLIRLKSPINFTNVIRPICLPKEVLNEKKLMSYRHCVLTGFGHTEKGYQSRRLQQGRMNIMSLNECAKDMTKSSTKKAEYFKEWFRDHLVFCVGSIPTQYGTASCQGDSGGPLVCKDEKRMWVQVGIVKGSLPLHNVTKCGNSIFTRVDLHLDFIRQVLKVGNLRQK